jgi:RecA-family ATPase
MATEGHASRSLQTPPPRRRRDADHEPPGRVTEPIDQPPPEHQPGNGLAAHAASQRAPEGFQTPPHDALLEARLLGVLMVRNDALALVRDRLRPEHFYEPGHVAFYREIKDRILQDRLADVDAMAIGKTPEARDLLYRVAQLGLGIDNEEVEQTANELIVLWQRREQAAIARDLAATANDLTVPAAEWRQKLTERLAALEAESPNWRLPKHIDLSRLAQPLPERRFLVPDWIPTGHVTSIYGEGSSGKSFLAMILGACMSGGIPWLGTSVTRCRVLGFFCEDNDEELLIRQNKILRGLALTWQDVVDHLFICDRVGSQNAMMTFDQGRAVNGPALRDIMAKIDEVKPRLLILDNIAHLYGGNENDRFQVTTFLNHLAGLARQIDGAVVLLGHPPKNEAQYSGSTAWSNNVRARLWLEKCKDDEDRWILRRAKTNYAEPFDLPLLRDPITGLVRPDDPSYETEEARHEAERKLGAARQHLKAAIDALNARDINTAPDKRASNHLLKVLEGEEMTGGFKRRVLERALQSLLTGHEVSYEVVGHHPKGAPKKGLVRTATLV